MDTPLNVERVSLDELHQDPANARTHGPENLEAIVASLKRFGQVEALVVQASTGRVIGGNGRVEAMRKIGWTHCDVVRVDVDDLKLEATAPSAQEKLEKSEAFRHAQQVLSELDEPCRELLQMVREGKSYREMSRQLGVTEGALRVRVLRCRRRAAELRTEMTWANIRTALEGIKTVTYRSETRVIVQTSNPAKSAAEILKRFDISKSKTILSVG